MSGITEVIATAGAVGLSLLNKAPTVYSFLDLSGSLTHPYVGSYVFTGQGVGNITITMDHDKTFQEQDVYGTVLIGLMKGVNGKIQIACQQSSNLNSWLGATAIAIAQEPKNWAKMTFLLRNIRTGDSFSAKGVTFTSYPEVNYATQGGLLTWTLMFADIERFIANPSGAGQMSALQKAVKSIV